MYDIEKVVEELKIKTSKPCIQLESVQFECSQFDSKVGGVPYMPNNFEYPLSKTNNEPLRLLAQINFEQMPHLENFPTKGILQFYIRDSDEIDCMYGINWDNLIEQKDFRIIYHKNVDYSINNVDKLPTFKKCEKWDFIVEHECKLIPKMSTSNILPCDVDFDIELEKTFKEVYSTSTKEDFTIFFDENSDKIWDIFFTKDDKDITFGHVMGGYPFFTQSDPREDDTYKDYTTLLLQLDTDDTSGIMWGDTGVGNFFIKPNDLKNLNFNDVLYNWDCY